MNSLLLLSLFLTSSAHQTGVQLHMSNQEEGVPYASVENYDALMICVVTGPDTTVMRRVSSVATDKRDIHDVPIQLKFRQTPVTVLSARNVPPGSNELLLSSWHGSPSPNPIAGLPTGTRLLVIASTQKNGKLSFPESSDVVNYLHQYPSEGSSEVAGLAYFETTEAALPDISDPAVQCITALTKAIHGTSIKNVESICNYMVSIELPPEKPGTYDLGFAKPDFLSKTFIEAVANETAYRRALVYQALNRHNYIGTAGLYLRAVREAISDPAAFPRGLGIPGFYEPYYNSPKEFGEANIDPPDPAGDVRLIFASVNPRITRFLIEQLPYPGLMLQKRLTYFLDDPDLGIRWQLVKDYADWNNDPAHSPVPPIEHAIRTRAGGEDTQWNVTLEYPGLADLITYWRAAVPNLKELAPSK